MIVGGKDGRLSVSLWVSIDHLFSAPTCDGMECALYSPQKLMCKCYYPICFRESDTIMHESGSTGSSSASSSFAEDEGTAGKTWFNPFIVRNDMIQNTVVAKLNKGLFPMESERTSVFTGLYVECANVS